MGDFGFKIAQSGFDVGTASDQNLVMTSKLNSYKIPTALQGSATISLTAGQDGTIIVNHNLGYIPAYDAWFSDETGIWYTLFEYNELTTGVKKIYAPNGTLQTAGTGNIKMTLHNRDVSTRIGTAYYIIFVDPIT